MCRVPLAVAFVVAASSCGCCAGRMRWWRQQRRSNPSDPHVAMGGHLFVQFACASCHGEQGKGGVSPDVPALKDVGQTLTAPS